MRPGTRGTRGTLSRPFRGFRGRFITRNGRVLMPADMERAVERLSQKDLFGTDISQLLALYANAPRPSTTIGKHHISQAEVRRTHDSHARCCCSRPGSAPRDLGAALSSTHMHAGLYSMHGCPAALHV
jgi:hypothetical protein